MRHRTWYDRAILSGTCSYHCGRRVHRMRRPSPCRASWRRLRGVLRPQRGCGRSARARAGDRNARMSASENPARSASASISRTFAKSIPRAERIGFAAVSPARGPSSRTCRPAPFRAGRPMSKSSPCSRTRSQRISPGTRMLPPSTTSTSGRSRATRRLTSCGSDTSQTTVPVRRSSGSITSCVDEVAVSTRSARWTAALMSVVYDDAHGRPSRMLS